MQIKKALINKVVSIALKRLKKFPLLFLFIHKTEIE